MTNEGYNFTERYAANKKDYRVWVACTYNLHPENPRKSLKTRKWRTGCYDMAEAKEVKELLQCFPKFFGYISIKENEHKLSRLMYQISCTDYRETARYLKARLKEEK